MTSQELEASLCAAYREQAGHYAQALAAADRLCLASQQKEPVQPLLESLAASLDQVARVDAAILEAKQAWKQAGSTACAELSTALHDVEVLIGRLLECFTRVEQELHAQQACLAPELELVSRGQQMRRAYEHVVGRA